MSCVKLPPVISTRPLGDPSYQSSYNRDYRAKSLHVRAPLRPTSVSRRHNPQPRHVFLLRRMFNEPVCNVWTPQKESMQHSRSKVALAQKTLMTCAQYSYQSSPSHPNFTAVPTRFGANRQKLSPAVGILPVTSVWNDDLSLPALTSSSTEPLNMDITGKKRALTAVYVLDQQLPQYKAMEDMKERSNGNPDYYLSNAINKPSRRKHLHTRPTSLTGSNTIIKKSVFPKSDRSVTLSQPWPANCYSCWAGPF